MAAVVELKVQDLAQAGEYYESLLAVNPQSSTGDAMTLVGDHVQLRLSETAGSPAADSTLAVTSGMLARVLDAAMKAKCQIGVEGPERVRLTDQYGQRWTLQCHLS